MLKNIYNNDEKNFNFNSLKSGGLSIDSLRSFGFNNLLSELNKTHMLFLKESLECYPEEISDKKKYIEEVERIENSLNENYDILLKELVKKLADHISQFYFFEDECYFDNVTGYQINLNSMELTLLDEVEGKKIRSVRGRNRKEDFVIRLSDHYIDLLIVNILAYISSDFECAELNTDKIINNQNNFFKKMEISTSFDLIEKEIAPITLEHCIDKIKAIYYNKAANNIFSALFKDKGENQFNIFNIVENNKLVIREPNIFYNSDTIITQDRNFYIHLFEKVTEDLKSSMYIESDDINKNNNTLNLAILGSKLYQFTNAVLQETRKQIKKNVSDKISDYIKSRNDLNFKEKDALSHYFSVRSAGKISFLRQLNEYKKKDNKTLTINIIKTIKNMNVNNIPLSLMSKIKEMNSNNIENFFMLIENEMLNKTKRLTENKLCILIAHQKKFNDFGDMLRQTINDKNKQEKDWLQKLFISNFDDLVRQYNAEEVININEKKDNLSLEMIRWMLFSGKEKELLENLIYLQSLGIDLKNVRIKMQDEMNLLEMSCHKGYKQIFDFLLNEKIFNLYDIKKDKNKKMNLLSALIYSKQINYEIIETLLSHGYASEKNKLFFDISKDKPGIKRGIDNTHHNYFYKRVMFRNLHAEIKKYKEESINLLCKLHNLKEILNIDYVFQDSINKKELEILLLIHPECISLVEKLFEDKENVEKIVKSRDILSIFESNDFNLISNIPKEDILLQKNEYLCVILESIIDKRIWNKEEIFKFFSDIKKEQLPQLEKSLLFNCNLLKYMLTRNEYGDFNLCISHFIKNEIFSIEAIEEAKQSTDSIPIRGQLLLEKMLIEHEKETFNQAIANIYKGKKERKNRI